MSMHASSPIFYIEGNTGSGKTTLLRALAQKHPHMITLEEPVDEVQNVQGYNALQLMYDDLEKWSFPVNLLYLVFHFQLLQKAVRENPQSIIVMDRSIFSGLAFLDADAQAGAIHPLQQFLYERLVAMGAQSLQKPHGFIYVRTQPAVSYERICKRNRKEEAHISADYWKLLHDAHDRMLLQYHPHIGDTPVLVLEYNDDMDGRDACIDQAVAKIEAFMQECMDRHHPGIVPSARQNAPTLLQ